eukprot:scaffold6226_cov118-Cylindrotheca_fusiformis.AAC.14
MACPVSLEFFDSTSSYEYESTALVDYLHSFPRLGLSKDIEELLLNENGEGSYLFGVCIWGFILSVILTVYVILLGRCSPRLSSEDDQRQDRQPVASKRVNLTRPKKPEIQEASVDRSFLHDSEEEDKKLQAPPTEYHQQLQSDRFNIKSLIYEERPPVDPSSQMLHVSESVLGTSVCFREEEQNAEKADLDLFFEGVLDDESSFPETTASNFLFQDDATESSNDKALDKLYEEDPTATLPRSKFISRAASRKRLLESYFRSLMNTSAMLTWNIFGIRTDPESEYPALSAQPGKSSSKRKIRIKKIRSRPRQAWSFAQVFTPPREEKDDGSTFQPKKTERKPSDSAIESSESGKKHGSGADHESAASRSHRTRQLASSKPISMTSSPLNSANHRRSSHPQLRTSPLATIRSSRGNCNGGFSLQRFRIITVIAGSVLMISIIFLIIKGVLQLDAQADSILKDWRQLQWSSLETKEVLNMIQSRQLSLYEETEATFRLLDQSCPAVRNSVCDDKNDCNVEGIPKASSWKEWLDYGLRPKKTLLWLQATNWTSAKADFDSLDSKPVVETLENWRKALAASTVCNTVLFFLVFLILWAIAMPNRQLDFQEYFISTSPAWSWLFWSLTLAAWALAFLFLLGSFIVSDACVESPNSIAASLLWGEEVEGSDYQSFLPKTFLTYFIDGCPLDAHPSVIQDEIVKWSALIPPTNELNDALNGLSAAEFDIVCMQGGSSVVLDDLQSTISSLSSELCEEAQTLASLRERLRCEYWYPHFKSMIYESTCSIVAQGLGWASMAEWIVVIMCLTIWTFREAFRTGRGVSSRSSHLVDWSWGRRLGSSSNPRREEDKLGKFPTLRPNSTEESSSTQGRHCLDESQVSVPKPCGHTCSVSPQMEESPSPATTPKHCRRNDIPTKPPMRQETAHTAQGNDNSRVSNDEGSVLIIPNRSQGQPEHGNASPRRLAPQYPHKETLGSIPELAISKVEINSSFSVMDDVDTPVTPDRSRLEGGMLFQVNSPIAITPRIDEQSAGPGMAFSPDHSRRKEERVPDSPSALSVGQFSALSSFVCDPPSNGTRPDSRYPHEDVDQRLLDLIESFDDDLSSDEITL